MLPVGFEPAIPAGERPQTYALDRTATGTGYIKYILKDPDFTKDIWRKCRGKLETLQNIIVAQVEYSHRHSRVANIVHQEFVMKCGLSRGPPMPCYKHDPQSALENFS